MPQSWCQWPRIDPGKSFKWVKKKKKGIATAEKKLREEGEVEGKSKVAHDMDVEEEKRRKNGSLLTKERKMYTWSHECEENSLTHKEH